MKTLEFDAEISDERTLTIPADVAAQVAARQPVHVIIELRDVAMSFRTREERLAAFLATAGSCKDDPTLTAIFEQIDRERHQDFGREVDEIQ